MAIVLGIESTCDETGAAVVFDGREVRSNVVASQVELHAKYRGVVPEIASRAHLSNLLPVIREALANSERSLEEIDAVAVASRPGLIGSLLVGVTGAKTLAWALGKPLVAVDHVQAHLYSVVLGEESKGVCGESAGTGIRAIPPHPNPLPQGERGSEPEMPAVGLVVSGGHTSLYRVDSWNSVARLGGTIDDAVGEAYDKVAGILGLGYPGGPVIDRLAREGDAGAVRFPRTLLSRESLDFSFSGIKTAVLYHVRGVPGKKPRPSPLPSPRVLGEGEMRDIAASFQAACVEVLMTKLGRAVKRVGAKSIIIGGGVSANSGLRAAVQAFDVPVFLPALAYCTDNAAMIAGLGDVLLREGKTAGLDLDAVTYSAIR